MRKRPYAVDIAMAVTIVLVIAVFAGIPVRIYFMAKNSYAAGYTSQSSYEMRWEINIPDNFTERLHYSSPHGFTGDGYRYTVYEVPNDVEFRSWNYGVTRQTSRQPDMDASDVDRYVAAIKSNAELPEEYDVPFDEAASWEMLTKNGNNKLIIIHFRKIGQVHFAEKLM
ncbi:MAG: hypothetical protein LBK23_05160 [Oscillospiraceae bacterium]|jgi:hypothetical protein|nr:hypothetical protein [Oscillospiraceae bacterium]